MSNDRLGALQVREELRDAMKRITLALHGAALLCVTHRDACCRGDRVGEAHCNDTINAARDAFSDLNTVAQFINQTGHES